MFLHQNNNFVFIIKASQGNGVNVNAKETTLKSA